MRCWAARNENMPAFKLEELAGDEQFIRLSVARNRSTSSSLLKIMVKDKDKDVKKEARKNLDSRV